MRSRGRNPESRCLIFKLTHYQAPGQGPSRRQPPQGGYFLFSVFLISFSAPFCFHISGMAGLHQKLRELLRLLSANEASADRSPWEYIR